MANSLTVPSPERAAGAGWLRTIGIATLVAGLLVIGGGYWLLNLGQPRASPEVEIELLALVRPERVAATLPLLALADYPPDQVWRDPLLREEWDGALAMWLFGPVRSDRDSIDTLLVMAQSRAPSDPDAAAALLAAAADVIRVSPELSDRERAELLLRSGEQFRAIGLLGRAIDEWRQASILAHFSPSMPALVRAALLQDLYLRYAEAGATRLAQNARQQSRQVGSGSGVLAVPGRIELVTDDLPDAPEALEQARALRRQRALETADRLERGDETGALYGALADALTEEGILHRQWVTGELAAGHPREVQAALLLYHIEWLQRERMLAWGLGGTPFESWRGQRSLIESELNQAWDALEVVRLDQSLREGVQERATLAQRDWWATRLVQARIGRDPLLDQPAVIASMVPNNYDPAGGETLRLDWIQGRFWRIPREFVGTDRLPE